MLLPCEVAVKCLLPPVRAMIARKLVTEHNLTQIEAAKRLGISQPAISLYERKMRGKAINLEKDPEITRVVENLAESLAKCNLSRRDFIIKFCEICKSVRAKGLLCQIHRAFEPTIDIEKCELCLLTNELRCI